MYSIHLMNHRSPLLKEVMQREARGFVFKLFRVFEDALKRRGSLLQQPGPHAFFNPLF